MWFTFGASYGASLATWLRLKHPRLVHAAVTTSGPLLAQVNFQDYFKVVQISLAKYHGCGNCVTAVADAFRQVKRELATTDGQQLLNEQLL